MPYETASTKKKEKEEKDKIATKKKIFYLKKENLDKPNYEIFTPSTFQNRLRRILNGYKISRAQLAQFGFVSKTTLDYWINGRSKPTIDALTKFSAIFGVSLDWIVGISPAYYNQPYISWLEYSLLPLKLFINDGKASFYPDPSCKNCKPLPLDISILSFPKEYCDFRLREIYYDQYAIRANLIFLFNMLKLDILTNAFRFINGENNETHYPYIENSKLNPDILNQIRSLLFDNPRLGLPEEIAANKFYKGHPSFIIPKEYDNSDEE